MLPSRVGHQKMTGKILVVDPVATNRIVMKAKLSAAFYDAESVPGGEQALAAVRNAETPDLILIADRITGPGAPALCGRLRALPEISDLPLLILSEDASGRASTESLIAGADDVLDRASGDAALFARIRAMLSALAGRRQLEQRLAPSVFQAAARIDWHRDVPAGTIGWVGERPSQILNLRARMATGSRVQILNPATVLGRSAGCAPDVIAVERDLGRFGSGLTLASDLRARPQGRDAAILIATEQPDDGAAAFDLGADAVLIGAVEPEALMARFSALVRRKHQRDRLREALDAGLAMAVEDPLTKLQNRRAAMESLGELSKKGCAAAIFMIDIDHFKSVNDRYGHAAGDAVLVAVARQLRESAPQAEVLGRIGGEEFLIAIPDLSPERACAIAERARQDIERLPIELPAAQGLLSVTISVGVAGWLNGVPVDRVLAAADAALYSAKRNGRNQVCNSLTQPA